jgi:hypothetical protein
VVALPVIPLLVTDHQIVRVEDPPLGNAAIASFLVPTIAYQTLLAIALGIVQQAPPAALQTTFA